jgi:diketogulonate reductase-like aldo/keto reductase
LNWHLHNGHIVIPKTTKKERLGENIDFFGFKLAEDEYKQIDGLDRQARLFNPLYWANFSYIPYWDRR